MGPPVVLLHGFATSTERTWREPGWFDLLKDARRRVFGIDLLGHGDADKPTDPAAYDDLVAPVMDQFPETPADVVGYSLGARTALEIAIRHPDRVNRLVLAAVGENLVATSDTAAGEMTPNVADHFESLIAAPGNDADALRACISRERRTFSAAELATVRARCLIVIGSDDFAGPPEPLADLLPDATIKVLPGIDHFGLPKQFGFIDAALEFIEAVPDWG
ncbi:MAG: alpha/beta fold hydrolase [Acidimicrobiales bacterium]